MTNTGDVIQLSMQMEDNGQQVAAEHTTDRAIDPESEKVHPAAQQATPAVQELPPEGTAQPIELGRPGSAAIKGVACASNQLLAGHDAHGQSNGSESEDPDAYDVVHLDRLLDYEQDDKFVWKDSEPIVARKGVAHSPGDPKGRHSGLQRGTFSNKIETSPMRQNFLPAPEPQMSVRRAKVHDSVPSSDSGPASQSGGKVASSLDSKGGFKGKKLQVPPGTMMRRRPVSARVDPLGEELDVQTHLAANTICHPLIARRRAIEKAARLLAEKEAAIAAANDETWKKKAGLSRPATAQGRIGARLNGQGTHRGVMRPASAMARMHEQSTAGVSESLRKTFEEHDNRMAALSNQITLDANVDMREAQFLKPNNEIDTPSKQRRATGIGRLLRGLLDSSTAVTVPTTDYEGGKPEVVKMGAEVQPRDHACTVMPQKISKASIEELSRTMDARLEAMIGWAERATDPMAADAKLSDWFGKWLKSYEYEQHGFKSAQVYGEVKMSEIKHSSSLASIENPNRFRTAVVCDIFGRIMPIFGRYKGLMQQIRHEMMTAIYSDLKEDDNANPFEKIPFFAGNAALAQEASDLKKERSRLVNELNDQEERVIALQKKIREYREEIQSVKLEAAWSRSRQNQMEVSMLSNQFGGDEHQELVVQNNKLKAAMHTQVLLAQASQDKVREMQHDMDILKIRVHTAEQEWKDLSKTIEIQRKELAMAHARHSGSVTVAVKDIGDAVNLTVVDWVNTVLGAPKEKPFLTDLERDLSDLRIYLELVNLIWGNDESVKTNIQVAKTKRSRHDMAVDTAEIIEKQVNFKLCTGSNLVSERSSIHTQILLELMCTHADLELAKKNPDHSMSVESLVNAAIRRSSIASTIEYLNQLDVKCNEQMELLNEMMGDMVDDEALEHHASSKLTQAQLGDLISVAYVDYPESQTLELATSCMQKLHADAGTLRAVFHYYCKLAERNETSDEVANKQATYLAGMETMDLDEFSALMVASKLMLPKLEKSIEEAYTSTIQSAREGDHPDLGMGFSHFEECLVRLAILLAPQWAHRAGGNGHDLHFAVDALDTLCTHIKQNCERLQHEQFGTSVRAENMKNIWKNNAPELQSGFKLYCSAENNSTMSLNDFLKFLKDTKIAGARLGVPAIVDIFSCVQEEGSDENASDTMDYHEFLEAMAACAVYMDPSPYLSLPHKVLEFLQRTVIPGIETAKNNKKKDPKGASKKPAAKKKK